MHQKVTDMNTDIIVGLDIGTTKIACLVGQRHENGKIEILATGKTESNGVRRGVVHNINEAEESIKKAVQEAEDKLGIKITKVNVGIAGQHIRSLQHRGMVTRDSAEDEISQADVDRLIDDMYKLVMVPGEEIIHVLPQEYIVDAEEGIKNPVGMAGIRLEANFHIIAGQIASIRNIYRSIERAGLEIDELILEPLASADAVLSKEDMEAGVALVDIGGGTTDLALFYDGIIRHTAVIPLGGNVITSDIQAGCHIMPKQAEILKTKFGAAIATPAMQNEVVTIPGIRSIAPKEISIYNLSSIIQARMEEIIDLVNHEIQVSGYGEKLIGGLVVTGGGGQLRHISQLFEYITGLNTRIGLPTEHLAKAENAEVKSTSFATGVGLVMKGVKKHEVEEKVKVQEERIEEKVQGHSDQTKRESFFTRFMKTAENFLKEDEQF